MKRILSLILVSLLTLSLTACDSSKSDKNPAVADISSAILSAISVGETVALTDNTLPKQYLDLDVSLVAEYAVNIASSGALADEIAIFKANDKEAVSKMWNICREDPGLWNARLKVMSCIEKYFTSDLGVFFDTETLKERLEEENIKYVEIESFLKQIYHSDWIDYLIINGDEYSYFYKNEQLKKCLTKAGTILELKVYITALNVKDKDGYSYFNDALCGVHIDWDGVFHNREDIEKDTANEIDVVLTKGIVPIFISCKNGEIKEDELYKLETVADRYGGKHVKKVLISTYFGNKGYESTEYLRQRAKDMKISFIEGVHNIDNDIQFEKMLKKLKNYCEMSFE